MTTHLERDLEAYWLKQVKAHGGWTLKLPAIITGLPDRLVILRGRVDLVELKTSTGDLRVGQRILHAKILKKTGYVVAVLRGREEVDQWFSSRTSS